MLNLEVCVFRCMCWMVIKREYLPSGIYFQGSLTFMKACISSYSINKRIQKSKKCLKYADMWISQICVLK